jgi:Zn-dependent protease with chaperone function
MRRFWLSTIGPLAVLMLCSLAWARPWTAEYETKVGQEATAEIEKQYKVVVNPAVTKPITEMANLIAKSTDRPSVVYNIKLVDDKEVNAFSIPGGTVYVTQALLKDVQSDHELAGVIGHEITHNTFYDALERAEKNRKFFMGSVAGLLAALLLGAGGDQLSGVLAAGEYLRTGILSQYSLEVETRADRMSVKYLVAGKHYNPVGMLTFMERLAARERHEPKVDMGIYADHPDTDLRCRRIIGYLEDAGVDVNRRAVTKWDPPVAEEKEVDGRKVAVLSLWGVEIFRTASPGQSKTALERTQALAASLKTALADNLEDMDIGLDTTSASPRVLLTDKGWLCVDGQDCLKPTDTPAALARQVTDNLHAALHKEILHRWY